MRYAVLLLLLVAETVLADALTIGDNGIDSVSTGLDGSRIVIGQIESGRPGKPNYGIPPEPSLSNTNPEQVYFRTGIAAPNEAITEHATHVASVMIGDDMLGGGLFEGVAPGAKLHAAAVGATTPEEVGPEFDDIFSLTADRLARISVPDPGNPSLATRMRAINLSFVRPLQDFIEDTNGNSHMTLFVDWSAARHDVLYVAAWGNSNNAEKRAPTDNFNGMTVAMSRQVDSENVDEPFKMFGAFNAVTGFPTDFRGAISLIAPGEPVQLLGLDGIPTERDGTSFATPHVTGTAALLQQYAKPRVDSGTEPRWGTSSQRHEVMKAVMMNAADKLDGVHGSTRDVLDINGNTWEFSPAYADPSLPLDPWTGTGHLNARRSVQQYMPGEHDPGLIPLIGWDYDGVGGNERNEYEFEVPFGGYIAATLAWDRRVQKATSGNYMSGDQFINQTPAQRLNDLNLYLMPVSSNNFMDAIRASVSMVQNVEHIFFDVPTSGLYKLVVHNNVVGGIGDFQNYALAWWVGSGGSAPGDYNGDGAVNAQDYNTWKSAYGNSVAPGTGADGNGDGIVDAVDYTVWRNNLGAGAGSGGIATVPEPNSLVVAILALSFSLISSRRSHINPRN